VQARWWGIVALLLDPPYKYDSFCLAAFFLCQRKILFANNNDFTAFINRQVVIGRLNRSDFLSNGLHANQPQIAEFKNYLQLPFGYAILESEVSLICGC
jgi:hypothetical protein